MKLTEHSNKFETNQASPSQEFGIGDASVIIDILRNRMYEHKIRTLVQEYICNGRDAQRESGTDRKMIVTVPNQLSPTFKVRDFGIGVNSERMSKVFILYGASTKRNTNNQTGGFGIGAKSAWSYTDSFTIVTFVDGVKRSYVAHTGLNNQGRLDLISTEETTEPNGTEIQIAVKPNDWREFKNSVFRAVYFWKEEEKPTFKGLTEIDIEPAFESLKIGRLEIPNKKLPDFIQADQYYRTPVLVIDGIPYPLSSQLANSMGSITVLIQKVKVGTIIRLDNGVVEVSASRESIADSKNTRDALEKVVSSVVSDVNKHIRDKFSKVKTSADWIATYSELEKKFKTEAKNNQHGDYSIQNENIISRNFNKVSLTYIRAFRNKRTGMTLNKEGYTGVRIDELDSLFFSVQEESPIVRNRRIRQYLEASGKDKIILLEGTSRAEKIDTDTKRVIHPELKLSDSLAVLKTIATDLGAKDLYSLPYTPPVRVPKEKADRTKEMFTVHEVRGNRKSPRTTTLADAENSAQKYLYVAYDKFDSMKEELIDMADFFQMHMNSDNLNICALTDKSIELIGGSDSFVPYKEWKRNFKPSAELLRKVKAIKAENTVSMVVLEKAIKKIKDAHVAKMINEYAGVDAKKHSDDVMPKSVVNWLAKELGDFEKNDKELSELLQNKYPLVPSYASCFSAWNRVKPEHADELVLYINAKN